MIIVSSTAKNENPELQPILDLVQFGDREEHGFFKDTDKSLTSPSVHDRVFFRSLCNDMVKSMHAVGHFPPSFLDDLMKSLGLQEMTSLEQKTQQLASMIVGAVISHQYIREQHDITKKMNRVTLVKVIYREHLSGPNRVFKIEIPFAINQQKAFEQVMMMNRVKKK